MFDRALTLFLCHMTAISIDICILFIPLLLLRKPLERSFQPGTRVWMYFLVFYIVQFVLWHYLQFFGVFSVLKLKLPNLYFVWTPGNIIPKLSSQVPFQRDVARQLLGTLSLSCPVESELLRLSAEAVFSISLTAMIAMIWIIGSIIVSLHYRVGHRRFLRMIKRWSMPPQGKELPQAVEAICLELNQKNRNAKTTSDYRFDIKPEQIQLLICDRVSGPMVTRGKTKRSERYFGKWKYCLILPSENYSLTELRYILLHELTHLRNGDLYDREFFLCICTLLWLNPLVWVMRRYADRDIELGCDSAVLGSADKQARREYCDVLLSCVPVQRGTYSAESTYFRDSALSLRERIENIWWSGHRHSSRLWGFLLVIPTVVIMCVVSVTPKYDLSQDVSVIESYQDARAPENVVSFDAPIASYYGHVVYGWIDHYMESLMNLPEGEPMRILDYDLWGTKWMSTINTPKLDTAEIQARGWRVLPASPDSPWYEMGTVDRFGYVVFDRNYTLNWDGEVWRCTSQNVNR